MALRTIGTNTLFSALLVANGWLLMGHLEDARRLLDFETGRRIPGTFQNHRNRPPPTCGVAVLCTSSCIVCQAWAADLAQDSTGQFDALLWIVLGSSSSVQAFVNTHGLPLDQVFTASTDARPLVRGVRGTPTVIKLYDGRITATSAAAWDSLAAWLDQPCPDS